MESTTGEFLVAGIALLGLALMPLSSRVVFGSTRKVVDELDGGRTGAALGRHLDRRYAGAHGGERALIEEETRQLSEAIAYVRSRRTERPPDPGGS